MSDGVQRSAAAQLNDQAIQLRRLEQSAQVTFKLPGRSFANALKILLDQ